MLRRSAVSATVALFIVACSPDPLPDGEAPPPVEPAAVPARPTAAPPAAEDESEQPADTITAKGWGPLRIGMTQEEVTAAVGAQAPDVLSGPEPDICQNYHPVDAPEGLLVMIEHGALTRISLTRNSDIITDAGLQLGASSDDVRAAYANVEVTPHKYVEAPAVYIDAWSNVESGDEAIDNPEARGIRYEINADGNVQIIHAGGPSIRYVEGCS